MINVARFIFNPFRENTYVIWDSTAEAIIVDPGNNYPKENEALVNFIKKQGLCPKAMLATHGHYDHVCGAEFLQQTYGIPLALSAKDEYIYSSAAFDGARYQFKFNTIPYAVNLELKETFTFGETTLKVIPTPGHSIGHISLYDDSSKTLFTGDTLMKGTIGRTDLKGGDYHTLMCSITHNLLPLGDEVTFYGGHGPESTLGYERKYNEYLL